jgi:hypothetical protein
MAAAAVVIILVVVSMGIRLILGGAMFRLRGSFVGGAAAAAAALVQLLLGGDGGLVHGIVSLLFKHEHMSDCSYVHDRTTHPACQSFFSKNPTFVKNPPVPAALMKFHRPQLEKVSDFPLVFWGKIE